MKKIALIGNPNTGKTSLFNQLTNSYAYVGNWSGVTVEKKVGKLIGQPGEMIDLPGVYTLNPLTEDEAVVSRFLVKEQFSNILNIVDASQLHRNLHLTIQLLELERPLVIGLNMVDVADQNGIRVNYQLLSEKLKVPVVPIIARTGKGVANLSKVITATNRDSYATNNNISVLANKNNTSHYYKNTNYAKNKIPIKQNKVTIPNTATQTKIVIQPNTVVKPKIVIQPNTVVKQKIAIQPNIATEPKMVIQPNGGTEPSEAMQPNTFNIYYGPFIEQAINKLKKQLKTKNPQVRLPIRWLALQFFEGNQHVQAYLQKFIPEPFLKQILQDVQQSIYKTEGIQLDHFIYRKRNAYIASLLKEVEEKTPQQQRTPTEKIDQIVTHPLLGIPIFIATMFLVFMLTFDWLGSPLSDVLDKFFSGPLTEATQILLTSIHASPYFKALVIDGIITGVGGVLVFIPQIIIMYIFISFLEDSGYMARVSLVMDRLMEKIGLNGKAFIPMIIGFGCNVPGVMAARTIEQQRERLLTIILMPLMSCSARLPVYALFAAAFFAKNQAFIVLSLYVLGIVLALFLAKLFSSTLLKNESSIFVIELPPYRLPHWNTLARSVADKATGFIKKAGTIIFAGSVFIWLLTFSGPDGINVEMHESYLAIIGSIIAPILEPLGFGTWQAGAAILTGFLAKEVVVSTMNIVYYAPDAITLQGLMTEHFTALSAYSFMAFILLYIPCMATVAITKKETNSTKWTLVSIIYPLVLAYSVAFLIYQIGSFLGY